MPQFKIEQLALRINRFKEQDALRFLAACGIRDWVDDTVKATGTVFALSGRNTANLRFNYSAFAGNELEILKYSQGDSWLSRLEDKALVTHIGMHISEADREVRHQ